MPGPSRREIEEGIAEMERCAALVVAQAPLLDEYQAHELQELFRGRGLATHRGKSAATKDGKYRVKDPVVLPEDDV